MAPIIISIMERPQKSECQNAVRLMPDRTASEDFRCREDEPGCADKKADMR